MNDPVAHFAMMLTLEGKDLAMVNDLVKTLRGPIRWVPRSPKDPRTRSSCRPMPACGKATPGTGRSSWPTSPSRNSRTISRATVAKW